MEENLLMTAGGRKTSSARMKLVNGDGKIMINGKPHQQYFSGHERLINIILQPLVLTGNISKFDIFVNVKGGGINGQAEAIRHAISKGLSKTDDKIKTILHKNGLLTRDPRAVERKKPGKPKARKRFQWTKR